ncbi:sigma 54-interacting transcriptional regulator [Clostridium sediminicola]|uniref:sigma-54 interaction domain-containing protein n=1 Tax=Clostridium sediminicola TaxID=3114879 RepID=UPI0031F1EC4C
MNRKTLTIISYNHEEAENYYNQLKSLFFENIIIEKIIMSDSIIHDKIETDLIITSSYDIYHYIKNRFNNIDIVVIKRTVMKKGLERILALPQGSEVYLIDTNIEGAKEIAILMYQFGIRNVELIPIASDDDTEKNLKQAIVLGNNLKIPNSVENIINLGATFIDVSSIIEIASLLELLYILQFQNINKSYEEIITINSGLTEILGRTNRFASQVEILLQILDDGIIAINSKGNIYSYNINAEKILGYNKREVIGKNGIKLMLEIPFESALEKRISIKEKLIKVNGEDIVVSVDPIINSDRVYGAVAILKRFSDTERKQHKLRAQLIGKGHKAKYLFSDILGTSEKINKCKEIAKRMSKSSSSILITGESGTGKELFAQAIHNISKRKNYQFVAVNCGAFPESLLESELFGYEEGAFTGARKGGKLGFFELAHKGTLFLDEIGEMPFSLQMRLLRVLQEREIMRIGGDRVIDIDVRIIAASNRDLKQMVKMGEFREDLYFRLNVLPLRIPSLRERKEDIFEIINHVKKEFNGKFDFTGEAMDILINYNWKGNVRELRNYIEYFTNLGLEKVDVRDLPIDINENIYDVSLYYEDKNIVNNIINDRKIYTERYIFILNQLENAYIKKIRLGRRSLYKIANEKGFFLSEQEIRTILIQLEKHSLVKILKGRSGTIITLKGREVLKKLQKG